MTGVEVGRKLTAQERARLRAVMRTEDAAQEQMDTTLRIRDALIRTLRWGGPGIEPVLPEELIRATVSKQHPSGLGRTTIHRIVGRLKDRPTSSNGSDQSGTSD